VFIASVVGGAAFVLPSVRSLSTTSAEAGIVTDTVTLEATADAPLRADWKNTNEGANPRLRVGMRPRTRAVIQFDDATLDGIRSLPSFELESATLILTVETNHHDWGQRDDHTVDAHRLLIPFVEGNGAQLGLPRDEQHPGTGIGATWHSPADPNVSDKKKGKAEKWNGGRFVSSPTARAVHDNGLDRGDEVTWDVTADVAAGASAWALKLHSERRKDEDDDEHEGHVPVGFQRGPGTIEYYAREGADLVGDPLVTPRLVVTFKSDVPETSGPPQTGGGTTAPPQTTEPPTSAPPQTTAPPTTSPGGGVPGEGGGDSGNL